MARGWIGYKTGVKTNYVILPIQDSDKSTSQFPQKPQHRDDSRHDPRQGSAHCDDTNRFLFKCVKPIYQRLELRFHSIPPVLAPDNDLQGLQGHSRYWLSNRNSASLT